MSTKTRLNGRSDSGRHPKNGGTAVAERPRETAPPASYPAVQVTWPTAGAAGSHAVRYGIDEQNLATRRQFIRLDEGDRALLAEMAPWAQSVASDIARDFYDWQFESRQPGSFLNTSQASAAYHLSAFVRIWRKLRRDI